MEITLENQLEDNLNSLPSNIRDIIVAAQQVDRESLDNVEVHPCDRLNDAARRRHLYDARRQLSQALADAGLTVATENLS